MFFFSLRNREPSAVDLCLQQFIYHMFEKKIDDAFGARGVFSSINEIFLIWII